MIRRELAKDPKLATESWDRFLPQFRKNHLKTSDKTAKKNERLEAKNAARTAAGLPIESSADVAAKKKVYTPFPPAQLPRKVDLQLESGEYFLKKHEKIAKESAQRRQKVGLNGSLYISSINQSFQQTESMEKRRAERAEAFVAPAEDAAPTVEEKRKRKRKDMGSEMTRDQQEADGTKKSKKKKHKVEEEEEK